MDVDPAPAELLYEIFQDDALELLVIAKGSSLTHQPDSPGPQGMADQPPNLQQELPDVRLWDAQSRKDLYCRHTEEGHRRNQRWNRNEDNLKFKLSKFSVLVVFKPVDPA